MDTYKRDRMRPGGGLRTLGSDSVGLGSRESVGGVGGIVDVGRVEGVEIGMTGRVLCYRGWMVWRGVVAEAGEDLFVQVLQVHIEL